MADEKKSISLRKINKRIDNINSTMDSLYNATYSTRVDNKNDTNRISDAIEDNLDDLLSNVNNQSVSDISNLLIRTQRKNGVSADKIRNTIEEMVSDNGIMDTMNFENIHKFIQAENYQYELILRYMPKLYEALDILKDSVLSSDNFTKEFANAITNKTNQDFTNIFNSRAKKLKEKYKIQDLFEDMFMDTAIYGESFVYIVPYKTAFERLLKRKESPIKLESGNYNKDLITTKTILESSKIDTNSFIDSDTIKEADKGLEKIIETMRDNKSSVILKMDPYQIIPEAVEEVQKANIVLESNTGLSESFIENLHEDINDITTENLDRGPLQYDQINIAQDGFINSSTGKRGGSEGNVNIKNMAGSVIHQIPRENIIPCYIGDYCIGYYYFSITNDYIDQQVLTNGTYNSIFNSTGNFKTPEEQLDKQNDIIINKIASDISRAIDAKFINSNIDLKEEIYAVLRYSVDFNPLVGTNTVNVTFLPAQDVHHFYFKFNKKRHRGISLLEKSLVPAMLYILLSLSDTISKVSRSQDKRIYYVKQNVETNVARTMLNVVNQIKRGNMGMRQLENLNTIFNVIGKYNDHIIPMSPSGDTPIQFEVMPGQQTETPSDLMDRQQEDAVNATGVPYEFTQSVNQVDFATRFTMSNAKFLRKVLKMQSICQDTYSPIFRKIYNFEYNENETGIYIRLPMPSFLTMTNSQQLIDNTKNFAQALADIELSDEEELKTEFIRLMVRNQLGTYIDFDNVNSTIETARQNLSILTTRKSDAAADALNAMGDIGDSM